MDWAEKRGGGGVVRVPPGAYISNNVLLNERCDALLDRGGLWLRAEQDPRFILALYAPWLLPRYGRKGRDGGGRDRHQLPRRRPQPCCGRYQAAEKASWCAIKVAQFDNFADEAIVITSGMACAIEDILDDQCAAQPRAAGSLAPSRSAGPTIISTASSRTRRFTALSSDGHGAHHRGLSHSRRQSFHQQLRRRNFRCRLYCRGALSSLHRLPWRPQFRRRLHHQLQADDVFKLHGARQQSRSKSEGLRLPDPRPVEHVRELHRRLQPAAVASALWL